MSQKSKNLKKEGKKFSRDKKGKIRKIIETTFNLIAEKGYDKVSTNLIAAESNMSIGSIYRYFPEGKSSIVLTIASDMYSKLPIKELLMSIDTNNFEDLVSKLIYYYVNYHRENFIFMKATEKASLSSGIVRDEIDSFIQQILHYSLNLLHKFPILAKIKPEELENKMIIILKTIDSVIHRHLFISPFFDTDEKLIDFLTKLALKTLEIEL